MVDDGVSIQHVDVHYGEVQALHDVTLAVGKGEVLALVGPSGCGKSTLLRAVSGLAEISSGSVAIDGREVTALSPARRNIGLVPQNYAMFPHMSVADNIAYGLRARRIPKRAIAERVAEMLDLTQLGPFASRRPSALSGGQRQRVALARALAVDPDLVLMDEPLSALDPQLRSGLRRELATLISEAGYTTIIVTHDQGEAMALGQRIAILREGRLVQHATPEELWNEPADSFVADFLAGALMLDVAWRDGEATALDGRWSFDGGKRLRRGRDEGRLLLRPDSLVIVPETQPGGIEARVANVEFAGDRTRLRVRLDERHACDVLVSPDRVIGRTVHVALRPEEVRLV
ncbi:ABC transporter ATP-binding protein [Leucobacter sp. wl10]|uniref:ABC transporter ATP-binding protein n=1 Tax=Leucobacter sp. wl10 TaxID=2304677 RepID=UPI000E5AE984|nr:ABC transporter ATP-binding protein [Leucobacter sp. wl10]RGE24203.1 ABC transporter ATP-binding protein [Leucobacter sp. wl10]